MAQSEESQSFVDFVISSDLRFFQERLLGLDLYHSGLGGIAVFSLAIASVTVFLLAMFHVIRSRKHTTVILLSLGVLALVVGALVTYSNYARLPEAEESLVRESGGALPSTPDQTAAVISLPLFCGGITLAFDLLGLAYLAVFWGAGVSPDGDAKRKRRRKRQRSA